MAMYFFRHRFTLADPALPYEDSEVELTLASGQVVILQSAEDKPITESVRLVLLGGGFPDEESARETGSNARAALEMVFAICRVAADFGDLGPDGGGPSAYLRDKVMAEQGIRLLADSQRLMVVEEADVPTMFMGGAAHGFVPAARSHLEAALKHEFNSQPVNARRQISYSLFAASHTTRNPEVRLLLLVMAIEVLVEDELRSTEECEALDSAIANIRANPKLTQPKKDSLLGGLSRAKYRSVMGGGADLVRTLSGRMYGEYEPVKLFKEAYKTRSDLVHGNMPRPDLERVRSLGANLELMVSHLIAGAGAVDDLLGPPDGRAQQS